jgi:parallel beta-helix repeat protein
LLFRVPCNIPVNAQSESYITEDGSIIGTIQILRNNNTYTLNSNVSGLLHVQKDDVIIDGEGFTLRTQESSGIAVSGQKNVTIKNIRIKNVSGYGIYLEDSTDCKVYGVTVEGYGDSTGIYIFNSSNNTIENCTITGTSIGIGINKGFNNTIKDNQLTAQNEQGIGLTCSSYNTVVGNNVQNKSLGITLDQSPNNEILENIIANCSRGIRPVDSSDNNTIARNTISSNEYGVEGAGSSTQNTFSKNVITRNNFGIILWGNNNISENTVSQNTVGILMDSGGDTIIGNTVEDNHNGIVLTGSDYVLKNNHMKNNTYNFAGTNSATNDIDTSNTVNGKPIYHWVNKKDQQVPLDAGYVELFNCVNITVQNLNLTNNKRGILICNTTESTITQNVFTLNNYGISLYNSRNNTISKNHIVKNEEGMNIDNSVENQIIYNNIAENNGLAIRFTGDQKDNIFHHNNFINNTVLSGLQVSMDKFFCSCLANMWNTETQGNYWSDHQTRYSNATQDENSGTWDVPFYINENNIDQHPLTAPVNIIEEPVNQTEPDNNNQTEKEPEWTTTDTAIITIITGTIVVTATAVIIKKRLTKKPN